MWNGSENQVILSLIRHGKTEANLEGRYLGRTDEDLTEAGKQEILDRVNAGYYPEADMVFTSAMKRCKTTAELIYPGKKFIELPEWNEIDFGLFEGKNYKELSGNPDYQAWIDSGGVTAFPGGESREQFIKRCASGMEKMVSMLPKQVERVSIVVHGGTIMALGSRFFGGDYFDYQIKNGKMIRAILERKQEIRCSIIS